jgi:hypothetical protein
MATGVSKMKRWFLPNQVEYVFYVPIETPHLGLQV